MVENAHLLVDGVSKTFGRTRANQDVHLELLGGQVHALLGQNGSGKSTLVGMLTGRHRPDEGRLVVDGEPMAVGDPAAARAAGVVAVHQELLLVPSMTGLENIAVSLRTAADRPTRSLVASVQEEFGITGILDTPVHQLGHPERQRLTLLRALVQRPRFLLLDEPTGLLPPTAVEQFLDGVRRLADEGLAVLLITHRLDEAIRVADQLSVLRAGRVVARHDRGAFPPPAGLAMEMFGERILENPEPAAIDDTVVLRVRDLAAKDDDGGEAVGGVSFEVRRGEVLGLAGVDGNGQVELLEALAGLRRPDGGTVEFEGIDITGTEHARLHARGIVFVSGDRQAHGIVPGFTVAEHFECVAGRRRSTALLAVLERFGVTPADPSLPADSLSGGNQQKVVVACALEVRPRLVLMSYPFHGLDVRASLRLREIVADYAHETGAAVIVASSELDDLLSMAHAIAVLNRGRIVGRQERGDYAAPALAAWFTGGPVDVAASA